MSNEQIILFLLMGGVLGMLLWGRWRYDLEAFSALVLGLLLGVVPKDQAFSGFGHPAVIIIALVLIVSRALSQSGARTNWDNFLPTPGVFASCRPSRIRP